MGSPGRSVAQPHSRYQTSHHLGLPKRSPSGVRRSSAAGIIQRPPLPPSISTRSHSLDGLLDAAANITTSTNTPNAPIVYSNEAEGASDITLTNNSLTPINGSADTVVDSAHLSTNGNNNNSSRRSRSLEDLLDERDLNEIANLQTSDTERYTERSKSMEHLVDDDENAKNDTTNNCSPKDNQDSFSYKDVVSIGSASSLTPTIGGGELPRGSDSITIDSAIVCQTKTSSIDGDDTISSNSASTYSRQGSTTSSKDSEKKKTFLNRYVKKVKSFIKK